jgi:hypothetical protein
MDSCWLRQVREAAEGELLHVDMAAMGAAAAAAAGGGGWGGATVMEMKCGLLQAAKGEGGRCWGGGGLLHVDMAAVGAAAAAGVHCGKMHRVGSSWLG